MRTKHHHVNKEAIVPLSSVLQFTVHRAPFHKRVLRSLRALLRL